MDHLKSLVSEGWHPERSNPDSISGLGLRKKAGSLLGRDERSTTHLQRNVRPAEDPDEVIRKWGTPPKRVGTTGYVETGEQGREIEQKKAAPPLPPKKANMNTVMNMLPARNGTSQGAKPAITPRHFSQNPPFPIATQPLSVGYAVNPVLASNTPLRTSPQPPVPPRILTPSNQCESLASLDLNRSSWKPSLSPLTSATPAAKKKAPPPPPPKLRPSSPIIRSPPTPSAAPPIPVSSRPTITASPSHLDSNPNLPPFPVPSSSPIQSTSSTTQSILATPQGYAVASSLARDKAVQKAAINGAKNARTYITPESTRQAMMNLSKAGIKVEGLGIGRGAT